MVYNEVVLVGRITAIEPFKDFYKAKLEVARTSGNMDTIPLEIPEHVIPVNEEILNTRVKVTGELHSPCKLCMLVETIFQTDDEDCNKVYVTGFIYRKGRYKTVSNQKTKTDFTLLTETRQGECAIVPCVTWNRAARWAAKLENATDVEVIGRIQSRQYKKHFDGETKILETYEVSVSKIRMF